MKKIFAYAALIVFVLIGCSKQKNDPSSGGETGPVAGGVLSEAGYGASIKPFANASWNLPAGVELSDSIHEYAYCWAFPPYTNVKPKDWKGIPTGFAFCLSLSNKTNSPITITFPPELVLISSSVLHQNILVIDAGEIQVPPGINTIVLQGFCLNEGRTIPQTYIEGTERNLSYSFGPSQVPAALKEITDIVHSKHISMTDVLKADGTVDNNKAGKYSLIQAGIWEVTDQQGLTGATKQSLKSL